MMKLLMTLVVIVLSVIMASVPALAQRGPLRDAPGYSDDISAIPGIHVTAEQKKELEALRDSYRRDAGPLQERLAERKASLRMLWLERHPDQQRIVTVQHEIDGLRKRLVEMDREYRRSVDEVLTPEQQELLQSQGRQRRGFGSGPHRGMGYGPRMEMKVKR